MRRRVVVAIATGAVLALGAIVAFASPAEGGLNLVCPAVSNPVAGQTITCTYVAVETPPTSTPPTTTTGAPETTTAPSIPGTTDAPTTTTTASPGFPTAATTGVPNGVTLASVNGSLPTVSTGQVIDSRLITGDLIVNHDNVTVTRSRIKGRIIDNNHRGLTLDQVDLGADACPAKTNGGNRLVNADDYTIKRSHLHHNGADLINLNGGGRIRIESSLLDGTCFYPGDHLDAIQMYNPGGVIDFTIVDSKVDNRAVNTSALGNAAIFIADNPGAGSRFTLDHTWWAGGGYTIRLHDAGAGSNVRFNVTGNVVKKGAYQYGPCSTSNSVTAASPTSTGVYWSGNKLDDGSALNGC